MLLRFGHWDKPLPCRALSVAQYVAGTRSHQINGVLRNESHRRRPAADMVDWMHHVDAERAELRELNELNLARFEARLTQLEATIVGRLEL